MQFSTHIGEALPQLILSCLFIMNNGGPLHGPLLHYINSISAIFSALSFLYGFVLSVDACVKTKKQKVSERYRQTLGMPYS